jgi:hypothetical protein
MSHARERDQTRVKLLMKHKPRQDGVMNSIDLKTPEEPRRNKIQRGETRPKETLQIY